MFYGYTSFYLFSTYCLRHIPQNNEELFITIELGFVGVHVGIWGQGFHFLLKLHVSVTFSSADSLGFSMFLALLLIFIWYDEQGSI